MSSMFRIIIITILSFNTLYSQILTNDYNLLFPESNLEIKYHDEWGAKNYKHVINNFKKNPLKSIKFRCVFIQIHEILLNFINFSLKSIKFHQIS